VKCPLCDTDLGGSDIYPMNPVQRAHRVCLLRSVVGGIGHLTDHEYWCVEMHDPDAGLGYYESALRVDDWVAEHGVA